MEKYKAETWHEKTHHSGLILFLLKNNNTKSKPTNKQTNKTESLKYFKKQMGKDSFNSGL